jgi:hypothetical protein
MHFPLQKRNYAHRLEAWKRWFCSWCTRKRVTNPTAPREYSPFPILREKTRTTNTTKRSKRRRKCFLTVVRFLPSLLLAIILFVQYVFGWPTVIHIILHGEYPSDHRITDKCSIARCLDINRCKYYDSVETTRYHVGGRYGAKLKIYIYPPLAGLQEFKGKLVNTKISDHYQQILDTIKNSRWYTNDSNDACLFMPPFSPMCEGNDCDPVEPLMEYMLHQLEFWHEGQNHLLFEMGDHPTCQYNSEKAITVRSSFMTQFYREGFDISMPLLRRYTIVQNVKEPILLPHERKYNIVFKGGITSEVRGYLPVLMNGIDRIVLTDHPDMNETFHSYDFEELLRNSVFGLAPRGLGVHSFRFVETLAAGSIPIVISDDWVLPFPEIICWDTVVVRVLESQILDIPDIITRIGPQQRLWMQRQGLRIYRQYLSSWRVATLTTLEILERRLDRELGKVRAADDRLDASCYPPDFPRTSHTALDDSDDASKDGGSPDNFPFILQNR